MSGVSLPVTRPAGRALLVGGSGCRAEPLGHLTGRGFQCAEAEDPYSAMIELVRAPGNFQCVVVSLQSLFREELGFVAAVKRRWPALDVWLTQTDGRAAALAEAMRLGADGLLTEDGLVRTAATAPPPLTLHRPPESEPIPMPLASPEAAGPSSESGFHDHFHDDTNGEPVLTAEELRALLHEPTSPAPQQSD
jgi:hypothetical protein